VSNARLALEVSEYLLYTIVYHHSKKDLYIQGSQSVATVDGMDGSKHVANNNVLLSDLHWLNVRSMVGYVNCTSFSCVSYNDQWMKEKGVWGKSWTKIKRIKFRPRIERVIDIICCIEGCFIFSEMLLVNSWPNIIMLYKIDPTPPFWRRMGETSSKDRREKVKWVDFII
jgi:hypothetical protein